MAKVFLDDGWSYMIRELSRDELEGILKMIDAAHIPERRMFDKLKKEITKILEIEK